MSKKLVDCMKKVSKKKGKSAAWGICIGSTGLKPHRKKDR